ncbi:MAG: GAF domain-containing protein [Magnetococcales bacterium]|nr:GAF domain-containing protein [Magnetococcales bacterium]
MEELTRQLGRKTVVQETMGAILALSTQPLPLPEALHSILKLLLGIPWLSLESRGSIFLADSQARRLRLTAQQGLAEELQAACANVPFGHCLCGRAAATRKQIFTNAVDDRHETIYDGMPDHGHYCLPILSGQEVLGVVNLYVGSGHVRDQLEEDFIQAVCHVLAGIIERRRAEESLIQARLELETVVRQQSARGTFGRVVVKEVLDGWKRDADPGRWPPPRPDHVAQVLETVFLASLQKKEEKPIRLCASLLESSSLMEEMTAFKGMGLRFASPFSCTPETLVALAPAFDPVTTSLIITPALDGQEGLEVIGTAYFSREGLHRFNARDFALTPLDIFSVVAHKAGQMLLFRGDRFLGRFASGQFSDPMPIPFTEGPMAWNLLGTVQQHEEYQKLEMTYWEVYRNFIDRILLEAVQRGKGGILIWQPASVPRARDRGLLNRGFRVGATTEAVPLLARYAALERRLEQADTGGRAKRVRFADLITCRREVMEMAELLAQLTCVDGALILSDRFQVHSFGSMLTAPPWLGDVVSWSEDQLFPSRRMDLGKRGARHNSAVNFVGAMPGTVAFVISQDGPVAGLARKDDRTIYWWPDCLSGLTER